jgi:hypothetical protein
MVTSKRPLSLSCWRRVYLAERGAKPVPLADMSTLVTGVVALRLAADSVLSLWQCTDERDTEADRVVARLVILSAAGRVSRWYGDLADGLIRAAAVPDPLPRNPVAEDRLVESLRRDLTDERGQATATAVRIIWTADHIDTTRRLQPGLVGTAGMSAGPTAR